MTKALKNPFSTKETVASATLSQVKISPRKLRLVVDLVRGKHIEEALQILRFLPKKGAEIAEKLLLSAISNARETTNADIDSLYIGRVTVDMGKTMKRFMPRAQGRATQILHRSSCVKFDLVAGV